MKLLYYTIILYISAYSLLYTMDNRRRNSIENEIIPSPARLRRTYLDTIDPRYPDFQSAQSERVANDFNSRC